MSITRAMAYHENRCGPAIIYKQKVTNYFSKDLTLAATLNVKIGINIVSGGRQSLVRRSSVVALAGLRVAPLFLLVSRSNQ